MFVPQNFKKILISFVNMKFHNIYHTSTFNNIISKLSYFWLFSVHPFKEYYFLLNLYWCLQEHTLKNHMWLIGYLNPYELQQSWECTSLKVFNCKKGYSQFSLDGPYWQCCLASNSGTGTWKIFLIFILSLYDQILAEKCNPNSVTGRPWRAL